MGEGSTVGPPVTESVTTVVPVPAKRSDIAELKDTLKEFGGGAALAAKAKAMEELGKVRHAEIVRGFQSVLSNQVHLKRDLDAIKAKLGLTQEPPKTP